MSTNMRCEKNSLALLSSKRTKAFSKSRADEAFSLPSFLDSPAPFCSVQPSCRSDSRESKLEPKVEHQVVDMEILKQKMLQHESMFKEQLFELHRLYKVQSLLMEETKKTCSFAHPYPGSLSFSSSESGRMKDERRGANKSMTSNRFPYFSGQIDVNKACEDKPCVDRLSVGKHNSQRPIIDLEQPAEEQTEMEAVENGEATLQNSFLVTIGNSQPLSSRRLQDSQDSFLSRDNGKTRLLEENGNKKCRNGSSTFGHSVKEEVSALPRTSLSHQDPSFGGGANIPSHKTTPMTSLFGVDLAGALRDRFVHLSANFNSSDHKRSEFQFVGSDSCQSLTGQVSKLPHWLVQDSQTGSAANMQPINSVPEWTHHTSPSVWQRHEEKTFTFDRTISSTEHEHWLKGGGLKFGEKLPKALHCMASASGYITDPVVRNTGRLNYACQVSSVNDSILVLPPLCVEKSHAATTAPGTSRLSSHLELSMRETDAASVFKELSTNSEGCRSSVQSWYHEMPPNQVVRPTISSTDPRCQRASNEFLNSSSSLVKICAHEHLQEGALTEEPKKKCKGDHLGGTGFAPFQDTDAELSSKRSFGFMPMAADLNLTLSFDLNADEATERFQMDVDSSSNKHLVHERHNSGLQSESGRHDFDLNEESAPVIDAESQMVSTSFQQNFDICGGLGRGTSSAGRSPSLDHQPSLSSSNLKTNLETFGTTTMTSKLQSINPLTQMYRHDEAPDDEQLHVAGICGGLFSGRSSDGSGLMSCESRTTPIPKLKKSLDDSVLSGEASQSIAIRQSPPKMPVNYPTKLYGQRMDTFSAMLGSEDYCCHTLRESPLTENCVFNNTYDSCKDDAVSKAKLEASEIADILVLLSLDLSPPVDRGHLKTDCYEGHRLNWLTDIIPQDDLLWVASDASGSRVKDNSTLNDVDVNPGGIGGPQKELNAFELAVLSLKPINPNSETLCEEPLERCDPAEDCLAPSNLRRRSLRRGRSGKDFQKDLLPSIASLSRHEIAEDLQIIEGLVKSATEAMAKCDLSSKEDVSWSLPQPCLTKTTSKARCCRPYKYGKQNGTLRACSWGESTCRKPRMRRQRRVFLPLGY